MKPLVSAEWPTTVVRQYTDGFGLCQEVLAREPGRRPQGLSAWCHLAVRQGAD